MTEIDVPDWVVKAAEDARVRCLNAVTAYGSAGVDERYHMAMKAAITAALGAWVVPAGYRALGEPCSDGTQYIAYTHNQDTGATYMKSGLTVEAIYALRQEKPDVLP